MFRIGSQVPPQSASAISSTAAQGGGNTSNQLQTLMASLDKAIADLSARFGSHPGGGDSMELPHMGGPSAPGMGMPGGSIGTKGSFAVGEPDPTRHGTPKSAAAAGTIGTQKSAETHPHHSAHRHHRHPGIDNPKPQPPVAEPTGPRVFAQGGAPGATVGTRGPVAQSLSLSPSGATPAPAPAGGNDAGLGNLGLVTGGGSGQATTVLGSKDFIDGKGGGGAPGGIIGTRGLGG